MTKKVILSILLVISLIVVATVAATEKTPVPEENDLTFVPADQVEAWEAALKEAKDATRVTEPPTESTETRKLTVEDPGYLDRATPEQLRRIANISDTIPGVWSKQDYQRETMIIMGDLDENAPRLTLAEAKTILAELEEEIFQEPERKNNICLNILSRFNEIHGAPDAKAGSGTVCYYYELSDSCGGRIYVTMSGLVNYSVNNTDAVLFDPFKLRN